MPNSSGYKPRHILPVVRMPFDETYVYVGCNPRRWKSGSAGI
jgi:hypothetical protein